MSEPAAELRYRIGMVSRLTGISTHTLRMWERRYQVVTPTRTDGGDRLYSASDVVRLRRVAELVERGHAISRVAPLSDVELGALLDEPSSPAAPPAEDHEGLIDGVIEAIRSLDQHEAERLLGRAAAGLEPSAFVFEIVEPLLSQVGDLWRQGRFEIYQEHLLSNLIRGLLITLKRTFREGSAKKRVLIATPKGERHEFGALSVAILAAGHGWTPTYLGTDLPADDIVAAAHECGAQLVLLSVTYGTGLEIQSELTRIEEALDPNVELVVGGTSARDLSLSRAVLADAAALEKRLSTMTSV